MTDDASPVEDLCLARVTGLGGPVTRALGMSVIGGLLFAGLGISGFIEGAAETIRLLSWLLTILGLLVTAVAGILLALGRKEGRPAVLSAAGIGLPGRKDLIPWTYVEDCSVRQVSGGQRALFARFTSQYGTAAGSGGSFLGRIPDGESGREILRRIESWRHEQPR